MKAISKLTCACFLALAANAGAQEVPGKTLRSIALSRILSTGYECPETQWNCAPGNVPASLRDRLSEELNKAGISVLRGEHQPSVGIAVLTITVRQVMAPARSQTGMCSGTFTLDSPSIPRAERQRKFTKKVQFPQPSVDRNPPMRWPGQEDEDFNEAVADCLSGTVTDIVALFKKYAAP
jgi:hypothetical protein